MRDLIDETKPGSHIFDVLRARKFTYSIEVFGKWFDLGFSHAKSSKVDFPLAKLELLGVERDA